HKLMSIMPTTVVSISDKCTENLMNYFKVPKRHIHKISNCVRELYPHFHDCPQVDYISIIYPARINNIKRQIEVYKHLKGKVKEQIKIKFVGTGPCYEELRKIIAGDSQFECLGFRNDVLDLLQKSNYMMLFSTTEGLPITLIEASMCGCPIICNDVGGNLEIAHDGENAFIANSWNELVCVLNSLLDIPKDDYMAMCAKSREIYLSRFTFDMFKQKYLELFSIL
ncbi:glycosyltransferase family 4 protein, partial [Phocaeicola sp.]